MAILTMARIRMENDKPLSPVDNLNRNATDNNESINNQPAAGCQFKI